MERPKWDSKADHHVVVVGGGFGGLRVAADLGSHPGIFVTLVDRRNFHLFQPLLYQVATGALSPANIAAPLRWVLNRHPNVRVWLATARSVDLCNRRLCTDRGCLQYDTLVVATGSETNYFGKEDWKRWAPGLKSIEDATLIRRRILEAFELAEMTTDPEEVAAYLTFVIVGAGPTGVELAGAIAELARDTLRRDFRNIAPYLARVELVDVAPRVLPPYDPKSSAAAHRKLRQLDVVVRTGCKVLQIDSDGVWLEEGDRTRFLRSRTVLWAAGVGGSTFGANLAQAAGLTLEPGGRVPVTEFLQLPGHNDAFVIGDLAFCRGEDGRPLPALAPVAIQQGRYVAKVIKRRLAGRPIIPFRYRSRGQMATVGRGSAVAEIGRLRFSGYLAWLVWLFVHLMAIVEFGNRLLIFVQWAWNYLTYNRPARLITEVAPTSTVEEGTRPAPTPGNAAATIGLRS
ncbi:MAG: NAD(P)/FAD-dependent oxidoreductase [Acidobacteriota bacterium]